MSGLNFTESPYVNRFISSKVVINYGAPSAQFDRVAELWFEGEEEWYKATVEGAGAIAKPQWAQQDAFPYLKPQHNIASIFNTALSSIRHEALFCRAGCILQSNKKTSP